MLKKITLLVCSSLVSQVAIADNNTQSVIDSFINCDSSFFYQLKNNTSEFKDIVDVISKDKIAYFPVEDIAKNDSNSTYFATPIKYRGLNVVGYQNIYIETPFLGQYYYWGLIIDSTTDDVKSALSQLPWQQYNAASFIANAKIYDRQAKDKSWQDNPYTIDNVIPRAFTVEKSLYLEPIGEKQVHLVCSIQGDMDSDLLYTIRPDMKYIDEERDIIRKQKIEQLKQKKALEKAAQDNENENKMSDEGI